MSSRIPSRNAMDCLKSISTFLERLNPTDINKPIKLNEKEIDKLILLKGEFEFHKKRIIIIVATSYFEEQIKNTINKIYERLNNATMAKNFFKMLLARGYHQIFDFEKNLESMKENTDFYPNVKKIDKFFNYLGKDFTDWMRESYMEENEKWMPKNIKGERIVHSIKCFLLLNSIRNKIVHGEYNTVDTIIHAKNSNLFYNDFKNAHNFIRWLPQAIEASERWRKEKIR